jgi:hypothetical protein
MARLPTPHTLVASVLAFLPNITLRDLKDISRLEGLASHLKKCLVQELAKRAEGAWRAARKRPL